MVTVNWGDTLVQQERYEDMLREAKNERLVRQALAGRERRERLYRRALTWLGLRLVAWGCYLQKRYSVAVEVPTPGTENSTC